MAPVLLPLHIPCLFINTSNFLRYLIGSPLFLVPFKHSNMRNFESLLPGIAQLLPPKTFSEPPIPHNQSLCSLRQHAILESPCNLPKIRYSFVHNHASDSIIELSSPVGAMSDGFLDAKSPCAGNIVVGDLEEYLTLEDLFRPRHQFGSRCRSICLAYFLL